MSMEVRLLKDKGTGESFVPVTHWDAISNKPEFFSGDYDDLINKPSIPSAQVQSDWAQSNSSEVDYIKNKPNLATVATSGSYNDLTNKPTIPVAQVNSDWNASSGVALILNKPNLAAVATSGSYTDLINTPSVTVLQVLDVLNDDESDSD